MLKMIPHARTPAWGGLTLRLKKIRVVFFQLGCLGSQIFSFLTELVDLRVVFVGAADEAVSAFAINQSLRGAFRGLDQFRALVVFLHLDSQVFLEFVAELQLAGVFILAGRLFAFRRGLVVRGDGFLGKSASFRQIGYRCLKHLGLLLFSLGHILLAFVDRCVPFIDKLVGLLRFISAAARQNGGDRQEQRHERARMTLDVRLYLHLLGLLFLTSL